MSSRARGQAALKRATGIAHDVLHGASAGDAAHAEASMRLLLHESVICGLPQRGERCLHIAPGSSACATVVCALLVGATGSVTTIELVPERAASIRVALKASMVTQLQRCSEVQAVMKPESITEEDVCTSLKVLPGNALLPHALDGHGPFDAVLVGADVQADQLPALLPLLAPQGRMVASVDGSLLIFSRRSSSLAASSPSSAFDRIVADRSFTLGARLRPYSRAELRASVAVLRDRAFAGGYESGAAMAQEASQQQAQEMQSRLTAANDKMQELSQRMVAVLHVGNSHPAATPGKSGAARPRCTLTIQCDDDGLDQGPSLDGSACGLPDGQQQPDEVQQLLSPAKRTRLTPRTEAMPSMAWQGTAAVSADAGGSCCCPTPSNENVPPAGGFSSGFVGMPGAAWQLHTPAPAPLQQQQQQPQASGTQPHRTPRKRRFTTSLASLFVGCSWAPATSTLSPDFKSPLVPVLGHSTDDGSAAWQLPPLYQGLQADRQPAVPCVSGVDSWPPGHTDDVLMSDQGQQLASMPPAMTAGAAHALHTQAQSLAAEQVGVSSRQGHEAGARTVNEAARALRITEEALQAAINSVSGSCRCLPVAGLPLLHTAALGSVLSGFEGGLDGEQRSSSESAGLACIACTLGGKPMRLWCQALPPGTAYNLLQPVCSGLLQRQPRTTALLAACWIDMPSHPSMSLSSSGTGSSSSACLMPAGKGQHATSYVMILEEGFGSMTLKSMLEHHSPLLGWQSVCGIARDTAAALVCLTGPASFRPSWSLHAAAAAAAAAGLGQGQASGGAVQAPQPTSRPTPGDPEGTGATPAAARSNLAAAAAVPASRLAGGTVPFCPALCASDVWCAGSSEGDLQPGVLAAKVSLVGPLLAQLMPPDEVKQRQGCSQVDLLRPDGSEGFAAASPPVGDSPRAQRDTGVLGAATGGRAALGALLLQLLTGRQAPGDAAKAAREVLCRSHNQATVAAACPHVVGSSTAWGEAASQLAVPLARLGLGLAQGAKKGLDLELDVLPALEDLGRRAGVMEGPSQHGHAPNAAAAAPGPSAGRLAGHSGSDSSSGGGSSAGAGGAARLHGVEAEWLRATFPSRRERLLQDLARLTRDRPSFKVRVARADVASGVLDALARSGGRGGGAATIFYQPLACSFEGEEGQDAGGVARDLLSTLTQQLCDPAAGLFRRAGAGGGHLYPVPGACGQEQARRYRLLGQVMAKALIESGRSAALATPGALDDSGDASSDPAPRRSRRGTLGAVALHLPMAPPFWRVLLGAPVTFQDLAELDPAEHASLRALLGAPLEDGTLFETFELALTHHAHAPDQQLQQQQQQQGPSVAGLAAYAAGGGPRGTGTVRLVPAGPHIKVTESSKREYVLRRARCQLVEGVERQMTELADGFWGLVPRALVDKYRVSPEELQRLVCGDTNGLDLGAWRDAVRAEGARGAADEEVLRWFWEAAAALGPEGQRLLLQFWSGSESVPLEGLASLDPPFQISLVDRSCSGGRRRARTLTGEGRGGGGSGGSGGGRGGGQRGMDAFAHGPGSAGRRMNSDQQGGGGAGGQGSIEEEEEEEEGDTWSSDSEEQEDIGAGVSGGCGDCRLPSAHTCGRVLVLPRYKSAAEMQEKLQIVLAWAREGMGLA